MQKPSIILTGATGLVGSRFVELYSEQFEIHNLDLTTGVDITNLQQVEGFFQSHPATSLIHLAAFTDTVRAESESGNRAGVCYRVNVLGTANIAQCCRQYNVHLIHVSTDFVFDGTKSTAYLESDPLSPLGWYGTTKALAEATVESSGAQFAITRLSYPYRANFTLKPDIITKIKQGLTLGTLPPQFTDSLITPTFVDDIAAGFFALLSLRHTGIYHLVGSTSLSPYDLAKLVATKFKLDPSQVHPGSLTEYLKTNPRPIARNGQISNTQTCKNLALNFKTIQEGLDTLITQS